MVFDFEGFNWGKFAATTLPLEFKSGLYECFGKVKDGDVIVDIGAGVGAIPWFILTNNKNPKRIHMQSGDKRIQKVNMYSMLYKKSLQV